MAKSKEKDTIDLCGFVYSSRTDSISNPTNALVTYNAPEDENIKASSLSVKSIPIDLFKRFVDQGKVPGIKLKDGALTLKTSRINYRRGKAEETYRKTARAAEMGLAGLVVGSKALDAAGSAGDMEDATTKATLVTTSAYTSAVVGTTTAVASTGTAIAALPIALVFASAAAIAGLAYLLSGAVTADRLFEYIPLKLIDLHVYMADNVEGYVAITLANIIKKKDNLFLMVFAYGESVKGYIEAMANRFPQLKEASVQPSYNLSMFAVPAEVFLHDECACGFNLVFNTQLLHDTVLLTECCKKGKVRPDEARELCNKLDSITDANVTCAPPAPSNTSLAPIDNIKAYCEKYGYTEERFESEEKPRLLGVLGCTEEDLDKCIGLLL